MRLPVLVVCRSPFLRPDRGPLAALAFAAYDPGDTAACPCAASAASLVDARIARWPSALRVLPAGRVVRDAAGAEAFEVEYRRTAAGLFVLWRGRWRAVSDRGRLSRPLRTPPV